MLRYRLLLASEDGDRTLDHLTRSWGAWLARKGYVGQQEALAAAQVVGVTRFDRHTMTRSQLSPDSARWRLVEDLDTGRWTSTLTFVRVPEVSRAALGLACWVEFTIDSARTDLASEDDAPVARFTVPRLAKYLLTGSAWFDGRVGLGRVHDVDRNRVGELVGHLTGPNRRLPALVFSSPPQGDRGSWDAAIAAVAEAVDGYATVWRLAFDATGPLQERLGETLSVWGGAVRTYLPRVRVGDPTEVGYTSRHRVLGWPRLRSNPDAAAAMLASACRLAALEANPWTEAPSSLNHVPVRISDLPLLLDTEPVMSIASSTTVEHLEARDLTGLVQANASLTKSLADLRSQAEAAFDLAAAAEEARVAALAEARSTAEDNALNVAELEQAQAIIRGLQLALAEAARPPGSAPAAAVADPARQYPRPDSFEDLLLILDDVPELTFTGDRRTARALDRHANRRAWLSKAWEACLTMVEYVRAVETGYQGRFTQWCDGDAPPGARVLPVGPRKALVPGEGEQVRTNPTMAGERHLPVPTSVDESGRAYMWAHVRLGGGGDDAPRMHYLESGAQIYIGYIGGHLRNTLT